jgi:hypothetical protein
VTAFATHPEEAIAVDDFWDFVTSWYFFGLMLLCLGLLLVVGIASILIIVSYVARRDRARRRADD